MVITLLDENFMALKVIDEYESFIWTDRFNKYGDFEYYNTMSKEMFDLMKPGRYLINDQSEHMMIIEGTYIISNFEEGNHLRVVGRSLESLLDRRIIWNQTILNTGLQAGIKKIIDDAFINPAIPERKMDLLEFEESTDDRILELKIESQYTGDNIYDIMLDLCKDNDFGYKITRNENNKFVMKLYFGEDRSNKQEKNFVVTFSPFFDNITSSEYKENTDTLKNVTLVMGEGQGSARKTISIGTASGLLRRELYTDARDLSTTNGTTTIPLATYNNQLIQRGKEKLAENKTTMEFTGKVDTTRMFVFGKDFFIGDIVSFQDEYGNDARVRVDEIIFTEDSDGYTSYPAFVVMDREESK